MNASLTRPLVRFEPADFDHYQDVKRRNVRMRLPRDNEQKDDTEFYDRLSRDFDRADKVRRRRMFFERDFVHLVDMPTRLLRIKHRDICQRRQDRLDAIGGSTDPIMAFMDHSCDVPYFSVDDGNNRSRWNLDHNVEYTPAFVGFHRYSDIAVLRYILHQSECERP